jgi:hypothetical protein
MRVIKFMFLFLMFSIPLNSEEGYMKPIILTNNFSGKIIWECLTPQYDFKIKAGYGYFQEFDTLKYKNKSLGCIIDDLSKKYELLDSRTFATWEKFKPEDDFDRTNFTFLFKKDDTTAIEINGCVNPEFIINERNDSVALEHFISLNSFILEALEINFRARFMQLKERSKKNNSKVLQESIDYCKKYFPKACE